MMDKVKLYLLRVFKNDLLLYHKTLRFICQVDDQFKFADLTNKGKFVLIKISEMPEFTWTEDNDSYKRIITLA